MNVDFKVSLVQSLTNQCKHNTQAHADNPQEHQIMFISASALNQFNHGIVVGARWASLLILQTAELLVFSHKGPQKPCSRNWKKYK